MRILFIVATLIGLSFSACSTHEDNYYDRANSASEKSLQGLDRDTK